MKKYAVVFSLVLCLVVLSVSCGSAREQYIRIHIRANSNESCDQAVKLEVRDAIIKHLEPLAASAKNKKEMMSMLVCDIEAIQAVAKGTLCANGFGYGAAVRLAREDFPEKTYGELTLEAGSYDALIITLGGGEGDNWWCVAFPPLCFIPATDNGTNEIRYKSKLAEWLEMLRNT